MLKIALKHNPDIRAAEAKRQVADAELQRTRLQVVKALSAFRVIWKGQSDAIRVAQQELAAAKEAYRHGKKTLPLVLAGQQKVTMLQTRLREIETELPFLLGSAPKPAAKWPVQKTGQTEILRGKARALAEQIVKSKLKSFQLGRGRAGEIVLWLRRLVETDLALAKSKADRIVATDTHRKRLMQLKKMTEALYRAGKTPQDDVLVVTYHLLQADRLMSQVKLDN